MLRIEVLKEYRPWMEGEARETIRNYVQYISKRGVQHSLLLIGERGVNVFYTDGRLRFPKTGGKIRERKI